MTSRRFWTSVLLVLAVLDVAIRFWLDFEFNAVLKAESFLFTITAAVLYLRLRREDSTNAWPRWVRSLIIAGLLLAVVRAGSHSFGLELYLANITTLAIAIIAAVGWRWRSGGRAEKHGQ
jgi:L-asparagine transporter-like permease